jgi:hypothetical protein
MPRITKNNPLTNYISREEIARIHRGIENSVAEQHKAEVKRRNRNTPTALLGVLQPDSEEYAQRLRCCEGVAFHSSNCPKVR